MASFPHLDSVCVGAVRRESGDGAKKHVDVDRGGWGLAVSSHNCSMLRIIR